MAIQEKQISQSRPADTDTVSIYSPGASVTAVVKCIVVANTGSVDTKFRIFIDDDGTTYDESTALFFDIPIDANSSVQIEGFYPMNDANGNLAVRSGLANALTFTVFGAEIT